MKVEPHIAFDLTIPAAEAGSAWLPGFVVSLAVGALWRIKLEWLDGSLSFPEVFGNIRPFGVQWTSFGLSLGPYGWTEFEHPSSPGPPENQNWVTQTSDAGITTWTANPTGGVLYHDLRTDISLACFQSVSTGFEQSTFKILSDINPVDVPGPFNVRVTFDIIG